MPFTLVWKGFAPGFLTEPVIRGRLLATLQRRARLIQKDFDTIVADWEDEPLFETIVKYAGGQVLVGIWTDNPIFGYLNRGTDERWAIMPNPKTGYHPLSQVRSISSTPPGTPPGWKPVRRGRKKMDYPMLGIEAREWTNVIYEKHKDEIGRDIGRVLANVLVGKGFKI